MASGKQQRRSQSSTHSPQKQQSRPQQESHSGVLSGNGSPALWGALLGLIVFAFVAVPISAAVRFATHPVSQQLFGGRLSEATTGGYVAFWWLVAILLFALPFLVGYGVAKLSGKTLSIIAAIIAAFFIAILILGQLFVF